MLGDKLVLDGRRMWETTIAEKKNKFNPKCTLAPL